MNYPGLAVSIFLFILYLMTPLPASAQSMGGMGGGGTLLCTPAATCFAEIEAVLDMYFDGMLDDNNATAQQKTAAYAAIEDMAESKAQDPNVLYNEEELVVIYKMRLLMEHDSEFTDMSPQGLPSGLKTIWFHRYEVLANIGGRGL